MLLAWLNTCPFYASKDEHFHAELSHDERAAARAQAMLGPSLAAFFAKERHVWDDEDDEPERVP